MELLLGISGVFVAWIVFFIYAAIAVVSIFLIGFSLYYIINCAAKTITGSGKFGKCLFGPCVPD